PGHHAQGHLHSGPYPRRLALSKKAICQLFGKWLRIEIEHAAACWGGVLVQAVKLAFSPW
ncbi:hypothetical protein ACI3RI_10485, partial [Lacticaseibacillus rhamnosus]